MSDCAHRDGRECDYPECLATDDQCCAAMFMPRVTLVKDDE